MVITSAFCISLSSPTPPSKTTTTTLTQSQTPPVLLNISSQREEKWRRQCLVGMACMVIGGAIQTVDLEESSNTVAAAKDMSPLVVAVAESKPEVPRWSDKRTCPPWHVNSLETIVPENLPRPSAKRRWEAVGNINRTSKKAPPVVKAVTTVKRYGGRRDPI
ncbi:Histone deacetylase-like protein [Melia azedarach]|uniref:Histone deacetylase-like protein n=1 Tax=Melia azedarach TaxID=155640 RepID=A0ACC1X956_MELAZ|nr:Histone deacetylase-like protein [Melia azedarach]